MSSTLKISVLNSVIRNPKPKATPWPESIINDMLKHLRLTVRKMLQEIYSWNKALEPDVWKTHLVPILKKEKDKINPGSYHPISLLSCAGKLMGRVISVWSPIISSGSWRPATHSAPHRQVTINITALKTSSCSSFKTLKNSSQRSKSCRQSSSNCQRHSTSRV